MLSGFSESDCNDGKYYDVPVHWNEYIPVVGIGSYKMKEEVNDEKPELDPLTRLHETEDKLRNFGDASIFHRHITSRMASEQ